jgi:hypothetical protein
VRQSSSSRLDCCSGRTRRDPLAQATTLSKPLAIAAVALLLLGCAGRPLGARYPRPDGIVEGDWNGCALEAQRHATTPPVPAEPYDRLGAALGSVDTGSLGTDMAVLGGAAGFALLAIGIKAGAHAAWGNWTAETVYIEAVKGCLQARGYPIAPDRNLPTCSVTTPPPCLTKQ